MGRTQQRRGPGCGWADVGLHHAPAGHARRARDRAVGRSLTMEERMTAAQAVDDVPAPADPDIAEAVIRVFRGTPGGDSRFDDFYVPIESGMVVLDALHWIQGHRAPDLAVRWNCKAAKCGSCSAEVNGQPRLTCKTRLSDFDLDEPITVEPMRAFPLIKDLVTDVSWNYEVNKTIQPFTPPGDLPQERWRWQQEDIERVQEYRKCI